MLHFIFEVYKSCIYVVTLRKMKMSSEYSSLKNEVTLDYSHLYLRLVKKQCQNTAFHPPHSRLPYPSLPGLEIMPPLIIYHDVRCLWKYWDVFFLGGEFRIDSEILHKKRFSGRIIRMFSPSEPRKKLFSGWVIRTWRVSKKVIFRGGHNLEPCGEGTPVERGISEGRVHLRGSGGTCGRGTPHSAHDHVHQYYRIYRI